MVRSSYHADGQRDIVLALRDRDRVRVGEREPVAGGAGPSQGPDDDRARERELGSREPVAGGAGPSQGPDDK